MKQYHRKGLRRFFKFFKELPSNLLTSKEPFTKILSAFLIAGLVWLVIRFITGPTLFGMLIILLYFIILAVVDVSVIPKLEPQAYVF